MRKPAVLLLALLGLAWAGVAQTHPMARDVVTVTADGQFEAQPDTAVVHFNINAQDHDSKTAYVKAQAAAEQVRQVLRDNGLDVAKAQLGYYQFSPVYKWDNGKQTLTGYSVSASVTIKIKDFSKVGPIVDQFGQLPTTDSMNVSYTLENIGRRQGEGLGKRLRQGARRGPGAGCGERAHPGRHGDGGGG